MKSSYAVRHGHPRTRKTKGHPARKARQERSYARGGSKPGDIPNPPHSA